VRFGIVWVVGDPRLELLDGRLRRGHVHVGEDERPAFVPLIHHPVQIQVDRTDRRPPPAEPRTLSCASSITSG